MPCCEERENDRYSPITLGLESVGGYWAACFSTRMLRLQKRKYRFDDFQIYTELISAAQDLAGPRFQGDAREKLLEK